MNRSALHATAILAAVVATGWAPGARADESKVDRESAAAQATDPEMNTPPEAAPAARSYAGMPGLVTRQYEVPNGALVSSGMFLFGTAYVASVISAATSERSADRRLFIPVAGPWMDLARRGSCSGRPDCANETTNKVLLVASGVLQGIGALQILGGFLFPTKYTEVVREPVAGTVHVSPTGGPGSAGVAATGVF